MSSELNEAIGLLDENKPYRIAIRFTFHGEPLSASMNLIDKNGYLICRYVHDGVDVDPNEWDRLGKSIGRNTSVRGLILTLKHDDAISNVAYECLEAFYRGVEGNCSIESLTIDMDFRVLPVLNISDAQFIESLNHLMLAGDQSMTNNMSFMISSVLDTTSLKTFDMSCLSFRISNESAFRRVVFACSRVNSLNMLQ